MPTNDLHYATVVRWSKADGEFVARIPELPGISGIAATPEQAVAEARIAAGLALEVLAEDGQKAPAPACLEEQSGQLRVRMPKTLHARLADLAELEGVSLNSLIVTLLSEGAGRIAAAPCAAVSFRVMSTARTSVHRNVA